MGSVMEAMRLADDPLSFLLGKYGYDFSQVKQIFSGKKYVAVLLQNGHIGVCATLGNAVSQERSNYSQLDLNSLPHRIVLNAYFCASLNYQGHSFVDADLFDHMDFRKYNRTVMVGYFASIVKKFAQERMPLAVFDLKNHVSSLSPEVEKERHLAEADAVILTSTSVFNNTFTGIINSTPDNCDIFMLGPSSIMSPDLLQYRNIKVISGAVFEESDHRVLQIIDNDGGTRDFLRYENKKILAK